MTAARSAAADSAARRRRAGRPDAAAPRRRARRRASCWWPAPRAECARPCGARPARSRSLEGGDAGRRRGAAVPGWSRDRLQVCVDGRRGRGAIAAAGPPLPRLLTAHAHRRRALSGRADRLARPLVELFPAPARRPALRSRRSLARLPRAGRRPVAAPSPAGRGAGPRAARGRSGRRAGRRADHGAALVSACWRGGGRRGILLAGGRGTGATARRHARGGCRRRVACALAGDGPRLGRRAGCCRLDPRRRAAAAAAMPSLRGARAGLLVVARTAGAPRWSGRWRRSERALVLASARQPRPGAAGGCRRRPSRPSARRSPP